MQWTFARFATTLMKSEYSWLLDFSRSEELGAGEKKKCIAKFIFK